MEVFVGINILRCMERIVKNTKFTKNVGHKTV